MDNNTFNNSNITNNILFLYKENIIQEIREMKDMIYYKEELLQKITDQIQSDCEHEIITDYIDLMDGYRESVKINYCKKCEKTFH